MSVKKTPSGNFEVTVQNKKILGAERMYFTFTSELLADEFDARVKENLKFGILLPELVEYSRARSPEEKSARAADRAADRAAAQSNTPKNINLGLLIGAWVATKKPAPTDMQLLGYLKAELSSVRLDEVTIKWCESWIAFMKLTKNYAPGTIRKRVASLSRCIDWHTREWPEEQIPNPFKTLPRGWSTYNMKDAEDAKARGKTAKIDTRRERRLLPGEDAAILAALNGHKPEWRERPLRGADMAALKMLYVLIRETGLRQSEAYRLRRKEIDLKANYLNFAVSKQWYGRENNRRSVPILPALHAELVNYLATLDLQPDDLVFPWWDGIKDRKSIDSTSAKLTSRFRYLFGFARCVDLHEHDLRHEATCKWYELRDSSGNWLLREAEIHKIMGWAEGSTMPMRYASFRAEDLSARIWQEQGMGSAPPPKSATRPSLRLVESKKQSGTAAK